MNEKGIVSIFVIAVVFLLYTCFLLVIVLGGAVSTLGPNETALQRIIGTSTLFIITMFFAVSGIGLLFNKKRAYISGIVAAIMGVVWFGVNGVIYKTINSFSVTIIISLLALACYLLCSKVKE